MAENTRTQCTGNCMGCTIFQRQYCASQIAYNNMRILDNVMAKINDLATKVDAIQNNEAVLFNPMECEEDISQEASGEENRLPRKSNN